MSPWTHALCEACWRRIRPGQDPVRLINPPEEICCCCAKPTLSGIYYRADPAKLTCNGVHACSN